MDARELTRTPWDVDYADFPREGTIEQRASFLLRYAILAPSSHNSQPWSFAVRADEIDVFVEESRWLDVADPDERELYVSVGCALENLLVAAEHFGFDWRVEYLPPGPDDRVAIVTLQEEPAPVGRDPALFRAITDRQTNHTAFDGRPLDDDVRDRLRGCTDDVVDLHLVTDEAGKGEIADLQATADERLFDDDDYRRELGYWIGTGALGASWLEARIGELAVRHLDLGDREGRKDSTLVRSASAVAVLTTETADRAAELAVGQTFERIALRAAADGVAVHPMSQILERPDLRERLAADLGLGDAIPQHLFRLGYATPEPDHTPRLPLSAVLRSE
jgi:nitroreductase